MRILAKGVSIINEGEFIIGKLTITILPNGNVFIQQNELSKTCGEGMEVPFTKFEQLIEKFYAENF